MTLLEVDNLTVRYGDRAAVRGVSFCVEEGQWVMLAGANGAGKSTLIHAVSQSIPYDGSVLCGGDDAAKMKPPEIAKRIGVLTQAHHVAYAFSAGEIVRLGRYCYSGLFEEDAGGEIQIQNALAMTGTAALADRSALTLSGGELQRVFLAQVFAQNPGLLILDEPASHLDLVYQKQIFDLLKTWMRTPGRAVLSVMHDLGLARAYGTHAVLLRGGAAVACGEIGAVFTRENLTAAYGTDVHQWMRDMLSNWDE